MPSDRVAWTIHFPGYAPVDFTTEKVLEGRDHTDPDISKCPGINIDFNTIDGKVDRRSHTGIYQLDKFGLPRLLVY